MGSLKDILNLVLEESIVLCATQLNGIENICAQVFEFDENRELNILKVRDNTLLGGFSSSEYVLGRRKILRAKVGFQGRPIRQQVGSQVSGARVHCSCFVVLSHCQPAVFCLLP